MGAAVPVAAVGKSIFDEGAAGNTATQHSSQTQGINLNQASDLQNSADKSVAGSFDDLNKFLTSGYGQKEIDQSNQEGKNYVNMLSDINKNGGAPNDVDRQRAQALTDNLFKPQQTALDQSFVQQRQDAARMAAQLGRPVNDPIVQAKMQQEQVRQQQMLSANSSAFNAQQLQSMPFQRLDLQGQLANARGGLATQAMQNRMTLMSLGQNVQNNERNYQLATSQRYGNADSSQHSGGGILGGIGAVTGVAGSIMGVAGQGAALASGMPGGGGGGNTIQGAQGMPGSMPGTNNYAALPGPSQFPTSNQSPYTVYGTPPAANYGAGYGSGAPLGRNRGNY